MQQKILGEVVIRNHTSQHYKTIFSQKTGFFVRVEDKDGIKRENVKDVFGDIKEINIGKNTELAFVTSVLTEKEFKEKLDDIGGAINYIRVKN